MALDKRKNFHQRLEFIRLYAKWVKSVPNEVWSEQQAVLINSLMKNARNFMMSRESDNLGKNLEKSSIFIYPEVWWIC